MRNVGVKAIIPYAHQWIDEEDVDAVKEVLSGDWLTTGPTISAFEDRVSNYCASKYAVSFSSGTAALHSAVFAAGVDKGDEVIVTPMTFAASSNCILYNHGKPIFADIDRNTYNIDPEKIEKVISERTKAIIPVDFTGQPCDLDIIKSIADKYDLLVIEDSSHSLGASYKGKKIGSLSDMTVFSFHPVKHITTGEGGIITTDSKELFEKLVMFRNHGITKNVGKFSNSNEGDWFYEQQFLGYNYRISDLQCALGISQLKKLDFFIKRRKEIVNRYNDAFNEIEGIITPHQLDFVDSSWHLYVCQLNLDTLDSNRRTIFDELRKRDIGVHVHYIPVYLHPYYQQLGYKKGLCPNAEWLYERIITLPLYPKMEERQISRVIEAVCRVIKNHGLKVIP